METATALKSIRQRIDALDDQIQDLLIERATLVEQVGQEKQRSAAPIVVPAREAQVIQRLLARHHGVLQPEALIRIWREIMGSAALLQSPLSVIVAAGRPQDGYSADPLWDLARASFGSLMPMRKAVHAGAALAQVLEGKVHFAVLPWPEDGEDRPWWGTLLERHAEGLNIIGSLPYGGANSTASSDPRGLVAARIDFRFSEDDVSFLALELVADRSRARILRAAEEHGFRVLSVVSSRTSYGSRYLLEVEGWCGPEDHRLVAMTEALEDRDARLECIGGYPVLTMPADAGRGTP